MRKLIPILVAVLFAAGCQYLPAITYDTGSGYAPIEGLHECPTGQDITIRWDPPGDPSTVSVAAPAGSADWQTVPVVDGIVEHTFTPIAGTNIVWFIVPGDGETYSGTCGQPYPDASNTGPNESLITTTHNSDFHIWTSGTYENFQVLGGKVVLHVPNVTLKNFKVVNAGNAIDIDNGAGANSGNVFEDCLLDGVATGWNNQNAAVGNSGYTLRRCEVRNYAWAAFAWGRTTIDSNYIHSLWDMQDIPSGVCPGVNCPHTEALHVGFGNNTILNNRIECPLGGCNSAAIFAKPEWHQENTVIAGNHVTGGAFVMYAGCGATLQDPPNGAPNTDVHVWNNHLVRYDTRDHIIFTTGCDVQGNTFADF